MNRRDWKKQGYKVIFFDGLVHLHFPGTGTWRLPVDRGAWMSVDNLLYWTNVTRTPEGKKCERIAQSCYCHSLPDSSCDFCSGLRRPEAA
jgi:hypothetical protein